MSDDLEWGWTIDEWRRERDALRAENERLKTLGATIVSTVATITSDFMLGPEDLAENPHLPKQMADQRDAHIERLKLDLSNCVDVGRRADARADQAERELETERREHSRTREQLKEIERETLRRVHAEVKGLYEGVTVSEPGADLKAQFRAGIGAVLTCCAELLNGAKP